ncbi:pyridoxamine 5'-phosphate oxidase [Citromicrobium bathyomarinum]|uniref:pyridoxamine 5'-phosphate oxidase n=1 Tax=Citromicrobium bathyomarinum TaxID=72174 RepID=UPI003CC90A11
MSEHEPTPTASALPTDDPMGLCARWFAEAREAEPADGNAMALATATPDGFPSVRMVLLKSHGPEGFTFYTNAQSRKGEEIRANARAALLFHWKSLRRQIRIEGPLSQVADEVADEYFHSRSRAAQLGAVASDQSRPLDERATFVERYRAAEERFAGGEVERPPHWTGFTLAPERIEFWLDRENRLHDRRLFVRKVGDGGDGWTSTLLYP